MTFPNPAATATSTNGTTATTQVVSLPASIIAGDLLLIALVATATSITFTQPAGWSTLFADVSAAANQSIAVFYKTATGTEGASVSVTSTSTRSVSLAYRIDAGSWNGTPEVSTRTVTAPSASATFSTITPSWGALDTLFIEVSAHNAAGTVTTYSTSYAGTQILANGSTFASAVASASRQLNATSDTPGTLTWSGLAINKSFTIAVGPVTSTPATGTSSASSAVAGVGGATNAASASSSAASAVAGVGKSTAASVGSIAASSSVSGVGAGTDAAKGTIAASSTVAGIAAATIAASGSIAATSSVSGFSGIILTAVGAISATSALSAVGTSTIVNNQQGDGEDRHPRKRPHANQRRLRPIYAQPEPVHETPKRQREHLPSADELRAALLNWPAGIPLPPIGDAPNYAAIQYARPADNAAELAQLAANRALAIRRFQDEEDVAIALLLAS